MKNTLSKIPVIKILLPFTIGIIFASTIEIHTLYAVIASIVFSIIFILTNKYPLLKITQSYYSNLPLIIICISLGCICYNINKPKTLPNIDYNHSHAKAIIQKIQDKDFSTNVVIDVIEITDSCGNIYNLKQKMTAWIEGNNYSLKEGDIISFKFKPQKISNFGNPEEFDYKKHMQDKSILYHVFIKHNDYNIIGQQYGIGIFFRKIQRNLINLFLDSQLNPKTKTFFITIILGDSSYLDKNVRERMSHVGIAHILALSGLHMGIIALLINILLIPLDYIKLKRTRLIVTLIITTLFVFITGLSHSAVRATIMINLVIVSKIIYRKNTSLNALLFAALAILIATPTAIYDIGFQLSFTSVLLILLISSKVMPISPQNELLYYFVSLIIISLITFFGTTILTAFYFNYISLISVFTNIILIPILPIIVGCGFIYLLFLSICYDFDILAKISDSLYSFIVNLTNSISNYPNSYIDYIYISPTSLYLYILSIIFFIIFFYKRRIFYIYSSLSLIIGAISIHFIEKKQLPTYGYVIFNDNKCTPILKFSNDTAQIIAYSDTFDIKMFKHKHKKFISKHQFKYIDIQCNPSQRHYFLGKEKVSIINDSTIKQLTTTPKIETDIVLITKGFYGNIEDITRNYNTKLIVISSNIYYKQQEKLFEECKKAGIKCHLISNHGAIYKYFNIK